MQITQEKFNELFDKLGMKPSASKLESMLADLGVTVVVACIQRRLQMRSSHGQRNAADCSVVAQSQLCDRGLPWINRRRP